MASLKIPVNANNEQALKDLMGDLVLNDKGDCVAEFTSEKNDQTLVIKIGDNVSGECVISEAPAIDPETGEEMTLLKEYTYSFELSDGTKFECDSTYLYSVSNIASRIFYKVLSAAKAKYGPVRSSVGAENKSKLAEERARFAAAKKAKASEGKAPKSAKSKKAKEEVEANDEF